MLKKSLLQRVAILSDCTDKELAAIASGLKQKTAAAGEIIFHEGDEGSELFIVKTGSVRSVIRTADGNEKELARFRAGDFFGEMSIVDDAPRSATCQAAEASVLLSLHERDFYRILESSPRAAIKLMYKMLNITAQRLKTTSRFVSDMVRWGNEASRRAITDEITGAYNRRYLDGFITDYHAGAQAGGKSFCIIMMDVDRFREINEAHGHEVGNKLLCRVVEAIKGALKPSDVLARYGGDEFTILLPETGLAGATVCAERIRKEVASLAISIPPVEQRLAVTVSQGIAGFPESHTNLDELKKMADRALYRAKEEGRNRAVTA